MQNRRFKDKKEKVKKEKKKEPSLNPFQYSREPKKCLYSIFGYGFKAR